MPKTKHSKRRRRASKNPPTLLILAGIALLLIAIFALKGGSNPSTVSALESQLDQALKDGRPTFVFLHSLDCIPCKEMMGVVADVYPDFQDSIVLIDVDVYDQNNQNILRRERLQSIPTLVFYDSQGTRRAFIGVMPADQFRTVMTQLTPK